jgi:hypothetical protein
MPDPEKPLFLRVRPYAHTESGKTTSDTKSFPGCGMIPDPQKDCVRKIAVILKEAPRKNRLSAPEPWRRLKNLYREREGSLAPKPT